MMEAGVMQESEFNRTLLDSMDEALTEVLSAEVKERLYRYLEARSGIVRGMLPSRLDDLASVLSIIFGPKANLVLARAIAKRLYSKLGIRFIEKPDYTLLNYFRDARIQMQIHSEEKVTNEEKQNQNHT
jgi:hypothetical protein